MTENKVLKMNGYFEEQIALCRQREKILTADERTDEANLEKIRANVYDIFRTVLSVAVSTCKGDFQGVGDFFRQKLDQIPSGWAASLEKARAHNDDVKLCIEQIKLEAVQQIRERFEEVWEGEQ